MRGLKDKSSNKERYAKYNNKGKREMIFDEGDWVCDEYHLIGLFSLGQLPDPFSFSLSLNK